MGLLLLSLTLRGVFGVVDIDCGVSTLGFLGEFACEVVSLGYLLQQDAFFGEAVVGIIVTTAQGLAVGDVR
jgi:hypothetical protein